MADLKLSNLFGGPADELRFDSGPLNGLVLRKRGEEAAEETFDFGGLTLRSKGEDEGSGPALDLGGLTLRLRGDGGTDKDDAAGTAFDLARDDDELVLDFRGLTFRSQDRASGSDEAYAAEFSLRPSGESDSDSLFQLLGDRSFSLLADDDVLSFAAFGDAIL